MAAPKKRSHRRRRRRSPAHARLGQHFFTSGSIARRIIHSIGLQRHQSVLELGAGEGFFTELIAPGVKSVTAIDIDPRMISRLSARFKGTVNVRVVRKSMTSTIEFGDYDVVFGNIPFNRTAAIFRKISRPPVGFVSCHLLVQTEAAYRLLGSGRPTELAVMAFPFFEVRLGMRIPRWAYSPPPSVDTNVLHIYGRRNPLIPRQKFSTFRMFVRSLLRSGNRKLSRVIGSEISYSRWRQICTQANIKPSDSHLALNMRQYVELFNAIYDHNSRR